MDARRVGEAGLVGWRGRVGERLAKWTSRRTRFRERDLLHAIGLYLFSVAGSADGADAASPSPQSLSRALA